LQCCRLIPPGNATNAPRSDTAQLHLSPPRTLRRQPPRPTTTGLQFFSEVNFYGRRRAFARAETAIPHPHPGRPGAHRPSPRARRQRWAGTTLPARWSALISVPSVQVSCRCGIAEPSNYNFISRIETDKILHFCTARNRIGHHGGKCFRMHSHGTCGDSRPRLSGRDESPHLKFYPQKRKADAAGIPRPPFFRRKTILRFPDSPCPHAPPEPKSLPAECSHAPADKPTD